MDADSTTPHDPRPALDEIDLRRTHDEVRRQLFGIAAKAVTLGRFRIEGIAGNGAMGLVYVAYDPSLERRIALKVIRHRSGSTQSSSTRGPSLIREARSLAKLTHPNVVPVYEVGEIDGEVFLAMELVEGTSLRGWLTSESRTWPDILEVFDQALAGLGAAHAAGLVHRDFKPDNVLIGTDRRVRVVDFGLASELEGALTEGDLGASGSATTGETGPTAGTPAYMALEVLGGAPATPASDQYGVGVSLHEALFGHRPADPRPTGAALRVVPKWVESVVKRAMAIEPAQRYGSMAELRAALRRDPAKRWRRIGGAGLVALTVASAYGLGSEPAEERCGRARAQLAGVWDSAKHRDVEDAILSTQVPYASATWARVREHLDAYFEAWVRQHTEACKAASVHHDQSTEIMDLRMACLGRAKRELSATVLELSDADDKTVENADRMLGGLARLARCADLDALESEVPPPSDTLAPRVEAMELELARAKAMRQAGHYDRAVQSFEVLEHQADQLGYEPLHTEVLLQAGLALDGAGRYDEAATALQRALRSGLSWRQWSVARRASSSLVIVMAVHQGRADEGMAYAEVARGLLGRAPDAEAEAEVRGNIATGLSFQAKYSEAEAEYRAVLSMELERLGPDHLDVAVSRNNLGTLLESRGSYGEAELQYRAALSARQSILGLDHPHVATSRYNLGNALQAQGKYDEAETELRAALSSWRRVLRPDHPDIASSHSSLGVVLTAQGRYEPAEAELRAALSIFVETLGPDHPHVASCRANLGGVLSAQGKYDEAELEDRAVYSIMLAALGADHPDVATARNNIGVALEMQRNYAAAEAEYRASLSLRLDVLGPDHPDVAQSRSNLGNVLRAQGEFTEAEAELRAALELEVQVVGPDHPTVATSRNNLATVLESQGKLDEAEIEYRAALDLRLRALGAHHPDVAKSRVNLVGVLVARGEHLDEALELAEAAWSRRSEPDISAAHRAEASWVLARLLWSTRAQRPRALALAREARSLYAEAGARHHDDRAETEAWLRARGQPVD